jgi:hypothetical protein
VGEREFYEWLIGRWVREYVVTYKPDTRSCTRSEHILLAIYVVYFVVLSFILLLCFKVGFNILMKMDLRTFVAKRDTHRKAWKYFHFSILVALKNQFQFPNHA